MKNLISLITFLYCIFVNILFASAQSKAELNYRMLDAAKNDQADSVKFWIEMGANVNYVDEGKFSALFYAIYNREYIKRCSQLNYYSDDPKYFFHSFTLPNYYKGGYETSRILIQKGINVNYRETVTPLMLASSKGDLRICKLLLDNGASISILDEEGNDAESYANGAGFKRVSSYLMDQQTYSLLPTYYEILLKMDSSINVNNFSKALEIGELALIVAKNELSSDHRDLEMIKKRLVAINEQLRKFDDAQNIQNLFTKEDLSETKEKVNGMMQYPGYYDMLSRWAKIAMNDGDYLKAEIIINGVIEYSSKYGIKEYEIPEFIFWLSHIYFVFEEFDKSEKLLNELLLKNIENEQYKKELHTGIYLELSQLNAAIGNIKGSKQYAERAINEMNQDEKANRSIALALIGESYFNENNYEKALDYFKESLVLAESFKDTYFLNYAGSKNNLGYCYMNNNELQNAEIIFEELKKEYEVKNSYGQTYSECLENLAKISIKRGDLLKAKYYSETAQRYKYEQYRTQSADLSLLASINYGLNNYRVADSLYQLSATWIFNSLKEKFLYLSEFDRNFYAQKKNKSIDEFQSFSFNYYPINQSIAQFLYNNELFRKGMLLNASQQVRDAINNSGDTAMIGAWTKLREIRNRINFLESQPLKRPSDMTDLEKEANELDKTLTRKSQAYSQVESNLQIRWQDVQSKLKDGEASIEFSAFRYFHKDWTDSTMYCALILKKGMECPVMVPLFEQKQLDSLLVGGNAAPNNLYASRGVTAFYENQLPNGPKLNKLIWEPLETELQDVKTVYYSPSGSLHQISFSALPIDTASYLCDKYNLVQLSSTRQLASLAWKNKPGQISSTALFGGIKYDLEGSEIDELQRSLPKNEIALSRGFTSDSSLRSSSFDSLPGTRKEVEAISTTLHSHQIKTSLYSGINGNEEAFKALTDQNIGVLHIATHGFFYPDEKENLQDLDRMMLLGEQKFRYVPNPLRRSGLILAGGNRTWNGEEPVAGMEDGILTAQEISEMNLQNTELVVLSACETGLGDIKGGEGVFGLQRAFKLAGVKTIIMSLWKVPDGSTSEMMQLFYSKWLGGMDKQEAFRETQREMRNRYPKSPKDWAGFVMLD